MKEISASSQRKNEKNLRKAYKALDNSISITTNITIKNESGNLESFKDVDIVLAISNQVSYIEIECSEQDKERFISSGLEEKYYADSATFDYKDYNDYQRSVKKLIVEPLGVDNIISIRL